MPPKEMHASDFRVRNAPMPGDAVTNHDPAISDEAYHSLISWEDKHRSPRYPLPTVDTLPFQPAPPIINPTYSSSTRFNNS